MKAMILETLGPILDTSEPLTLAELEKPLPGPEEILIRVNACGICHTELDEIEGRTPPPRLPVVPGHQAVGVVEAVGDQVSEHTTGERVGVAWINSSCGHCPLCQAGEENLCPEFRATGRDSDGGYAEYMTIGAHFAHRIPEALSDLQAAPLLCAGAIGYRSMRLTGLENGQRLGLTGFGASAHLVLHMVRHRYPDMQVYVFARSEREQAFARELGAVWAGQATDRPPELLDAIIDTTPVWTPIVEAMACLTPGGRLVINAIRKEEVDKQALLAVDYPAHLWMEKEIKSVANVSRRDVREFLELAAEAGIQPEVKTYRLEDANRALCELRKGDIRGAKVLVID